MYLALALDFAKETRSLTCMACLGSSPPRFLVLTLDCAMKARSLACLGILFPLFRYVVVALESVTKNRSLAGNSETLKFYEIQVMEFLFQMVGAGSNYEGEAGYEDFLLMWESCNDDSPIVVKRHSILSGAYPSGGPYPADAEPL